MRAAARRARRAGSVALILFALAAGLVAAPVDAGAAGPSAAAGQPAATIELVDQPEWVQPGEPFTVVARVTDPPEGATVDMVVHDSVESRSEFRDTLDGELGRTRYRAEPAPVTATGAVEVGFTPSTDARLTGRGVYPVEVRLLDDDDEPVASTITYLTYLNEPPGPPLDVAVVVDIAAPPALQPDGSIDMSSDSVSWARQRIQAVEAAGAAPVTLAPLPETVEGLADSGAAGSALVDQLRELAATHQVVARPFVDIDLAALQDARIDSEAYAQSDAGANVSRSRLAVEPAPGIWLSGETWSTEGAQRAAAISFGRAVVPPTAVADSEDVPMSPVRLGDDGPIAMVSDADLAAHLTSDEGMVGAHRFLAELAITWLEAPSVTRGIVVHLPPDGDIDPEVVGTALAGLRGGQAAEAVPLTQIFDEVPPAEDGPTSVELAPAAAGPDLRALAPRITTARTRIGGASGLVDDPTAASTLDHMLLMVTGVDTPDRQRRPYLDSVDASLGQIAGAVTLPDAFRITLTTRTATVPIKLTNHTEENITVRVELDSDQLEFPDGDVLTPTLAPGTTRLDVRVRTRTSGAFTLDVTVTSPDDSFVLDRSTFDIRSTAISGVGLLLSVGSVLFLAIWWGRHLLRARRARGEDDPDEPAPASRRDDRVREPVAPGPPAPRPRARSTADLAPWAAQPAPRPAAPPPPPASPPAPPPGPPPPPGGAEAPPRERARSGAPEPYRPAHMARSRGRSASRRT
jgi:hypothetical protein